MRCTNYKSIINFIIDSIQDMSRKLTVLKQKYFEEKVHGVTSV